MNNDSIRRRLDKEFNEYPIIFSLKIKKKQQKEQLTVSLARKKDFLRVVLQGNLSRSY